VLGGLPHSLRQRAPTASGGRLEWFAIGPLCVAVNSCLNRWYFGYCFNKGCGLYHAVQDENGRAPI
jgi:hypothetical protein